MDYDEVNNCMTEQQKNSLKTAALQQLLQKVLGGAQEYTSYDDVNNQLTEQQKNSYQTAALQQLAEAGVGGGDIVDLTPYFDPQTFTLDVEEVIPLVREGGHIYSLNISGQGEEGMTMCFSGAVIQNNLLQFTGVPVMMRNGTSGNIVTYNFAFDATTGAIDPSSMANFPATLNYNTTQGGDLKLHSLTINVGSATYEYDGSQDVNVTIADGENMGF